MNKMKKLIKEEDKHYNYIVNFVNDYTKDDDEKIEFFRHLNGYLGKVLEIEKECNL